MYYYRSNCCQVQSDSLVPVRNYEPENLVSQYKFISELSVLSTQYYMQNRRCINLL